MAVRALGPRFRLMLLVLLGVGIFATAWRYGGHRAPPGPWLAKLTPEEMRLTVAKEREWSNQQFTGIDGTPAFREGLSRVAVRVGARAKPEQVEKLFHVIEDQLICRSLGSLDCYMERLVHPPTGLLTQEQREKEARLYALMFKCELPQDAEAQQVFEEFWNTEYADGGRRFKEVALGPKGSLIVISETSASWPMSSFSDDEFERWKMWRGARVGASIDFHPSQRSMEKVLEEEGSCLYAEVAILVRSVNSEVWSWITNWYFDPEDNNWHLRVSSAGTSRSRYLVPF